MSSQPFPAHTGGDTYPLYTPAGLYHMQMNEWKRGELKLTSVQITHDFTTRVHPPLRPGPLKQTCTVSLSQRTTFHARLVLNGPKGHLSSPALPLTLRSALYATSYCCNSGEQAGECKPPLFYLKLGLLCPIKKPPAVRRQPEQQLSEDTAIKKWPLTPMSIVLPIVFFLSALTEECRQQEALLKVWEEQAGKQELLAVVFSEPFMWSAEKSPVNMDDGCFCTAEWLRPPFRIY